MPRNITYDAEDMKNKSTVFSEKFQSLESVNEGNKVGIDENGLLYREYNGLFQGVVIWWYSQSRDKLL